MRPELLIEAFIKIICELIRIFLIKPRFSVSLYSREELSKLRTGTDETRGGDRYV